MASKGVGKTPSSREVEAFSQKAHLIFLVILQAASLYASQSSQFIDFALSNWLVLVHSLVALVIPLVLYVLMTKLLRKIRSFNFLLESQSALWSTSIVILHPTFAHRTLGITQYYILIIMGFAVYLLSQKEKENAENTAKQSIKSTHFIAFLVILAIFAGFTTHPGISFVGSVCLSAWLQGYMNIDVPKVVQYVATGLSLTLWTCQHFQLLPSTQHIAPQCETFMDYFNHFILYLINFGNKLVGFCLPINL